MDIAKVTGVGIISGRAGSSKWRLPHVRGVYAIENTVTRDRYIGASADIGKRVLSHKSALRSGRHCNALLLAAWRVYGESAFSPRVIDLVPDPAVYLHGVEVNWIHHFKAAYNVDNSYLPGSAPIRTHAVWDKRCAKCWGVGWLEIPQEAVPGERFTIPSTCPKCNATGIEPGHHG